MLELVWFKHQEHTGLIEVSDKVNSTISGLARKFNLDPDKLRIGGTYLTYDSTTGEYTGFWALLEQLRRTDPECGKSMDKAIQLEEQPAAAPTAAPAAAGNTGSASSACTFPEHLGTGNEGLGGQKYSINRKATCERIYEQKLAEYGYIAVLGPPESGKTGLLQCMNAYLKSCNVPSVLVNCSHWRQLGYDIEFDSKLAQELGNRTLHNVIEANEPLVLLVDEAQLLWNEQRSKSTLFWEALKRIDEGCSNVRVILAAAYGTKRSAADDTGSGSSSPGSVATPAGVVRPGRNIYVHRGEDGYGLAFSEDEWEEVCNLFERHNPFKLEPLIRENIYGSCAGQVGLVMACLHFLESEIKNSLLVPEKVTANIMYKLTSPKFLKRMELVRSFFRFSEASKQPGATAVLSTLFYADHVGLQDFDTEEEQAAARKLHKAGMVVIDEYDRVQFTSPIHKIWYYHQHHTERPAQAAQDIDALIVSIFERMDRTLLGKTDSLGKDGSPLESCWEAETYRVCTTVTTKGTVVSTQFGQAMGSGGPVDVYLGFPYCTALEFVRNGDRLSKHLQRFKEGGRYWPLVKPMQGSPNVFQKYAVIDIRKYASGRRTPRIKDDLLYTVHMSEDWSRAEIWHNGELLRPQPVELAGNAEEYSTKALDLAIRRVQGGVGSI